MCKRNPGIWRFETYCNKWMLLQIRGKVGLAAKREDVEIPGVAKGTNCGRVEKGSSVAEARDIG